MAQVERALDQNHYAKTARHGKHPLEELDASRVAKHLVIFRPNQPAVEEMMARARLVIPNLSKTETCLRVLRYNPVCIFAVSRKSRFDPENPVGEGFIAMLPLSALGLQQLALGSFNGSDPDLRLIAKPDERPAGIYMWSVFLPGHLVGGVALFMEQIATPQYAGVNLYSCPNTDVGKFFNEALGLIEGTKIGPIEAPHLWIFQREAQPLLFDTYVPNSTPNTIGVAVARTLDDLRAVIAIRSVVDAQQSRASNERDDGNDLGATHLIGYVGDELGACIRVRYFADFAKLERLSVRAEFQKTPVAVQLIKAGLQLCQKKGYRRVMGHSQARLLDFWSRFGFRTFEGAKTFVHSNAKYVEMFADVEVDPDAVTIDSDPYLKIRPEGRWHIQGILEKSASRASRMANASKGY